MMGAAEGTGLGGIDLHGPIVLTGRGGSGTRLYSRLLQQLRVFIGNRVTDTEDSLEWVDVVYRIAAAKLASNDDALAGSAEALRANARSILAHGAPQGEAWGWKLPETILVLPEVAAAFERCRIIHVVRHPLDTCLRRSHMTSRTNNQIGRAVLAASYRRLGWDRDPADDPEHLRNAASWFYQVERAQHFQSRAPEGRMLTATYESLCDSPGESAVRIAGFLGIQARPVTLEVDAARRRLWQTGDERAHAVWDVCSGLAESLGYRFDGMA